MVEGWRGELCFFYDAPADESEQRYLSPLLTSEHTSFHLILLSTFSARILIPSLLSSPAVCF